MALIEQEVTSDRFVEIPGGVLDVYRQWRTHPCSAHTASSRPRHPGADLPQVRGRLTGRVAQTQHRGPAGLLQRRRGRHDAHHRDRRRSVGAPPLAFACALFGLECGGGRSGASYDSKPYRRLMIEAFGATVHRSPLRPHRGRPVMFGADPANQSGSLGIAISEAVEVAARTRRCATPWVCPQPRPAAYQTVIGEGPCCRWRSATPTHIVGCTGVDRTSPGCPSRSCARSWRARLPEIIAAEPELPVADPGVYAYDFGDTAG